MIFFFFPCSLAHLTEEILFLWNGHKKNFHFTTKLFCLFFTVQLVFCKGGNTTNDILDIRQIFFQSNLSTYVTQNQNFIKVKSGINVFSIHVSLCHTDKNAVLSEVISSHDAMLVLTGWLVRKFSHEI